MDTDLSVTYLRRGMISILDVIAVKLPQLFTVEILPKLDVKDTLNLAQVNKAYNDAVWSAEGVRSMRAKIKAHLVKIGKGRTTEPMYWAAKHGNIPAVRALLKVWAGHPHYQTAVLRIAAGNDHASLVKFLIEAGADVNVRASNVNPNQRFATMHTALYAAADRGHTLVVMELIKAGADVNIASSTDCTPLYLAASRGHDDIVALLIEAGANLHKALQPCGWTPLQVAVDKKHEKIVKMLRHFGG